MKNLTAIFVMAILLFFTSNDLKASQNPSSRGGAISGLFRLRVLDLDDVGGGHQEYQQK